MKEVQPHRTFAFACIAAHVFLAAVMIVLPRVADVSQMSLLWILNAVQLLLFVLAEAQAISLLSLEKGRAIWPRLMFAHTACLLATVVATLQIISQSPGRT